jgi:hypothetical protein
MATITDADLGPLGGKAADIYGGMIAAEFPVNAGTEAFSQSDFYTWRLFGSPYMLLDDPPTGSVENSGFLGGWYMNQLRESQILTVKLGVPKYTGNQKSAGLIEHGIAAAQAMEQGESLFASVGDQIGAAITMNISGLDHAKRHYIFYNQYEQYIQYVRLLIVSMASYLNIMNYPIPEFSSGDMAAAKYTRIKDMDWSIYTTAGHQTNTLRDMITSAVSRATEGAVPPRWFTQGDNASLDSAIATATSWKENENQGTLYDQAGGPPAIVQMIVQPTYASESFGNSLTKSSAQDMADSTRAIGKEIGWLTQVGDSTSVAGAVSALGGLGGSVAADVQAAIGSNTGDAMVGILGSSIVGMLRGLSGERMIFPKIYDDSTFDKAVSFVCKLVSPQGDLYSYFINVGLPLCYMIPMCAPKTASINAYKMPFLCQAYVTGQTAMPMCICSSLSITRGASGAMNRWGLPLEVDVSISFQDLYQNIAVSAIHDPAQLLSNESLIEYIASFTQIETWNKAKINRILGDIAGEVAKEAFDPQKIADRATIQMAEYLGNTLRLYGVANAAR